MIDRAAAKISKSVARYLKRDRMREGPRFPIVSFTFDDCIHSAIETGGELLSRYSVKGTYYISGGLTDHIENGFACHSKDDLNYLVAQGHELGSHLFHHVKCQDLTKGELKQEMENSIYFLKKFTKENDRFQFSYPFGSVDLKSKKLAREYFASARGILPGININGADLANLRAIAIYSDRITRDEIADAISKAVQLNGWLIFYTHEVTPTPGNFGTTPEMLQFAIETSLEQGCTLLPVGAALQKISQSTSE